MINIIKEKGEESVELIKVHFFYIVFILAMIIVFLATRSWTTLKGFPEYLSVAATITSLVLGVVAIIYSFVSNGAMSQFLGSIDASSSGMREVSVELRTVSAEGQKLQARAEKRNDELHEIMGNLRSAVESISSRTAEIAGGLEKLPTKFGALQDAIWQRMQTAVVPAGDIKFPQTLDTEQTATFISKTSPLGLVAMKALVDATLAGRYCDLQKLLGSMQAKSVDFAYVYGFLMASSASGILALQHPKDHQMENGLARLNQMSEALQTTVIAAWEKRKQGGNSGNVSYLAGFEPLMEASIVDEPQD